MFEKLKRSDSIQQDAGMMEQEKPENKAERTAEQPQGSSDIGIGELMNKRAKLEEAIDYVGLMIKNLKDKLVKVSEYIEEENRGIRELASKRAQVENEADEVGSLIGSLRNKLANIDSIVEGEENRVKSIKETRPKA